MKILSIYLSKVARFLKRTVLRDKFLIEVSRWFKVNGDTTYRLNYTLNNESVVFDLGGYHGDFAHAILEKFNCKVYIFEPVPDFYKICTTRFEKNPNVTCFNFGLSDKNETLDISLDENSSSFFNHNKNLHKTTVKLQSINDFIKRNNITRVDLLKINIEGGEFNVIPALIQSDNITKIRFLQVQFHNFIENAHIKRKKIREDLSLTHSEMWNFEFVWESWALKENLN